MFPKSAAQINIIGIGFDFDASNTHQVNALLECWRVEYIAPQRISGESAQLLQQRPVPNASGDNTGGSYSGNFA